MRTTRRTFLQMSWGMVTLVVTPVPILGRLAALAAESGEGWSGPPGQARYRIDGLAKVLGEKIYARDFRVSDMPTWPQNIQRMALVIRAQYNNRPYMSLDLSMLPSELQPLKVVDQAQLDQDQVQNISADTPPPGSDDDNRPQSFMVGQGQIPLFLGQPLAILIFADTTVYARAKRILQFNNNVVTYGPVVDLKLPDQPYQWPVYLTRYADYFSQTEVGTSNPYACSEDQEKLAQQHAAKGSLETFRKDLESVAVDCAARAWRIWIDREMEMAAERGWQVYRSQTSTQVLDPMFMEPEAGLAWYDASDAAKSKLSLVLGTQSPNGDIADTLTMYDAVGCPFQVAAVELTSCYPGGGFGGRDASTFPPLLTLAAVYADGPVRMAHDRFEQFQAGIKQLGSQIEQALAVDAHGHFQALSSNIVMRAGGKNNYSQFVAELAAYCAAGAYHIPRAVVDAIAEPSAGVVAGSMRGFGGPQAFLALETLVDQVARDRGIDAIELRHRNALRQSRGDHTVTGAPLIDPLPIAEICERAQQNPLWQNRPQEKAKRRADETLYGVGFALANQAFGTGADGVMAAIEVDREGRLTVISNAVDMGNGSATTLAITTAKHLGVNAADIRMGQADLFSANLKLSRSPTEAPIPHEHRKRSHVMFQNIIGDILHPSSDKWLNPHYTPSYSMSSSACITAFQQVHAVHQASLVFRDTAVWPAAAALWAVDANNQQLMQQIHWDQERLVLAGHPALPWPELAKQMWSANGVVATMIHACFQAKWVTAAYPLTQQQVGYHAKPRWAIDGLALRQAKQPLGQYTQILRQDTDPPPPRSGRYGRSLYAPSATLAAVEVSRPSGVVKVLNLYTYLDAGTILQRDLVLGQYEGGAAMGIGYALLEDLPLTLDGAGTGRWNLNQYHVALAADVPVQHLQLELLTPRGKDAPAKGIAEAVLCPIAPAIANAIADATGFYITDLPITADKIQQRWRMSQ